MQRPIEILLEVLFPLLVALFTGLTMGGASPAEFWIARIALLLAAIDLCGLIVWWLYKHSGWGSYLVGLPIFVMAVLALSDLFQWINEREIALRKAPSYVGSIKVTHPNELLYPRMDDKFRFEIGDSGAFISGQDKTILFPFLQRDQMLLQTVDGKLKVSTRVTDAAGNILAEVSQNEWKIAPPPRTWDRNYSDDALEVKDPSGAVVLQVKVLPDKVQIQGIWRAHFGIRSNYIVVKKRGTSEGGSVFIVDLGYPLPEIEPLFKYPGDLHIGELR